MTTTREYPSMAPNVDLTRWPAMAPPRPAPVRAAIARALLARVAHRTGVTVVLPNGSRLGPTSGPVLTVRDPRAFLARLGRHGNIGFGEAYMAGDWEADDLVGVLEPIARNVATLVPSRLQRLRRFYDPRLPATEDNNRRGARRNIARHYDLSNDLFATFLDETMTYSSALFTGSVDEPLAVAQRRKIDRLLDLASVGNGTRLLEIGTGWGELAIRAARRGARVTTLTLSSEQADFAARRASDAGVAANVEIRRQDYRDADGTYDAIVSVEMVEAVGEKWWPTYFRTLDQRLAPGGAIGLQAILMPHDRMLASRSSWSWINKYVFPGGIIMSERAIEDTLAAHTTLRVADRLHFGASYAETLRRWRETFVGAAERVAALGFDETFRRMWTMYLAYSEAGFRAGYLDVGQFLIRR
ncbi:MAG: cyclopropane-fatty-acyl-phospholipid synthase [Frankiaceae bacterium]|jgi:cyclopropane-fatty-acyl-phospholipid synthase|nr:cyclopropane-fatty-acyl-phospholipid synthase [Frankiaceae bacterium]